MTTFFCGYCGTQIDVEPEIPEVVEVVEAQAIEDEPDQSEERRKQQLRDQIEEQKKICDRAEVMITPVAMGLIAPSFFGGFIGCSLLGASGRGGLAFLVGALCIPVFILGITLTVYFSKKKERAEAQIKELERQLGKDVRSFGEKILDKGLGWIFGKKKN